MQGGITSCILLINVDPEFDKHAAQVEIHPGMRQQRLLQGLLPCQVKPALQQNAYPLKPLGCESLPKEVTSLRPKGSKVVVIIKNLAAQLAVSILQVVAQVDQLGAEVCVVGHVPILQSSAGRCKIGDDAGVGWLLEEGSPCNWWRGAFQLPGSVLSFARAWRFAGSEV